MASEGSLRSLRPRPDRQHKRAVSGVRGASMRRRSRTRRVLSWVGTVVCVLFAGLWVARPVPPLGRRGANVRAAQEIRPVVAQPERLLGPCTRSGHHRHGGSEARRKSVPAWPRAPRALFAAILERIREFQAEAAMRGIGRGRDSGTMAMTEAANGKSRLERMSHRSAVMLDTTQQKRFGFRSTEQPVLILAALVSAILGGGTAVAQPALPARGICAHRGAMVTHPENTITAFSEAIRLGAHMIEFDVRRSADGYLVVIHDATVDRTTNGTGPVSGKTLAELKSLDAGSWKGPQFAGERIPTLTEALAVMPNSIWLNVHIYLGFAGGRDSANEIFATGRGHQAFLSVEADAAAGARAAQPTALLNNMENRSLGSQYVDETIAGGFDFIQFPGSGGALPLASDIKRLKAAGIHINHWGAYTASQLRGLFAAGIEFPLYDDLAEGLQVAKEFGIRPHGSLRYYECGAHLETRIQD